MQHGAATRPSPQPRTPAADAPSERAHVPPAGAAASALALRVPADGEALSAADRDYFQPRLGVDLGGVRVHAGGAAAESLAARGAEGLAAGEQVALRERPDTSRWTGRALLGHELAHVVQQRRGGSGAGAEGEARRAGVMLALGLPVTLRAGAPADALQASKESDDVKNAWDTSGHDKGRVFDRLRALCPLPGDADLTALLASLFAAGTDDLWLAQTLQKNGPEPLWPAADLDERGKRAAAGKWPDEPGNIAASLGKTKGGRDVSAYYFRGQTDERALIIAGVHGTEQSGVEVVETLRTALTTGPRPYYTVIIVPRVFPDNVAKGIREGATETNRNFPKPGESLSTATTAGGSKGPVDAQGKPILPENVMLMQLIERFHPSRIASVHATWDKPKAGIFSDPHTVSAGAKAKAGKAGEAALQAAADKKTKDDEALAIKMATEAEKKGAKVPGNKLSSGTPNPGWQAPTPGGTSMGGWGPSDITEGKPTDRASMSVITVEVSGDEDSSKSTGAAAKAARLKEFEALRDVLRDIFLGP